ncbi:MAG: hypothetical protein JNM80_13905 [Phycisphaerae bacterium]|nr:hypothetical protein [Phycisphaerae bacterium]
MQPSSGQLQAMLSAGATGLTVGLALYEPGPWTGGLAGLAGGIWLATLISNSRANRLAVVPTLPPEVAVADEPATDRFVVEDPADAGAPESLGVVRRVGHIPVRESLSPGDVGVRLTSVLARHAGMLNVFSTLWQNNVVAVSCVGQLPKPACDDIETYASQMQFQEAEVERKRRASADSGLRDVQILRFQTELGQRIELGPLMRLLREIRDRYGGIITDFEQDASHFGQFQSSGLVCFGFPRVGLVGTFLKQLRAWQAELGKGGWRLQPAMP